MLYIASTVGHLKSFHRPYLERLAQEGWEIHTAGRDGSEPLPGGSRGWDIPFEKNMLSFQNWRMVWKLKKLLQQEHYDLISVHTSLAAFFLRLAVLLSGQRRNLLVVNTVHGYLFDKHTPTLKKSILLAAEKITAPATDLLWTMNEEDTQIAIQHRLCPGQVEQIKGMGVDMARFFPASAEQRQEARCRFGFQDGDFVLVYVAEFSKRKNQKWLIQAIQAMPSQIKLLLAGRGGELEACQTLVHQLGLEERVHFAGFVPDVECCYHAADVCVSASRSEGLPFNVMEAMHCALPIIATQVKGHEDLVTHGTTGYLFPFEDRAAFQSFVLELQQDPAQAAEMGRAGAERAEQYRLERVLEENLERLNSWLECGAVHQTKEKSYN